MACAMDFMKMMTWTWTNKTRGANCRDQEGCKRRAHIVCECMCETSEWLMYKYGGQGGWEIMTAWDLSLGNDLLEGIFGGIGDMKIPCTVDLDDVGQAARLFTKLKCTVELEAHT